jgi:hypothetical protein
MQDAAEPGRTAIDVARLNSHEEVLKLLDREGNPRMQINIYSTLPRTLT